MTRFEKALALALAFCIAAAAWQVPFSRSCEQIRGDTLRLHIVANSDSEQDQAIKLAVRDALLADSSRMLGGASSRDEAISLINTNISDIENTAAQVLRQGGFSYGAKAYITRMYFGQRSYDGITLPAGYYTALRIELGAADGQNWWCVVYPSLCVPTSVGEDGFDRYDENEQDIITGAEDEYEYRFLLEEWLQTLFR